MEMCVDKAKVLVLMVMITTVSCVTSSWEVDHAHTELTTRIYTPFRLLESSTPSFVSVSDRNINDSGNDSEAQPQTPSGSQHSPTVSPPNHQINNKINETWTTPLHQVDTNNKSDNNNNNKENNNTPDERIKDSKLWERTQDRSWSAGVSH